jgi:hypothetical protein
VWIAVKLPVSSHESGAAGSAGEKGRQVRCFGGQAEGAAKWDLGADEESGKIEILS